MRTAHPMVDSRETAGTRRTGWWTCALALWLVLALLAAPARPQQLAVGSELHPALQEKLAKRGKLDLRDTSLPDALLTVGELWQVNLVFGDDIQGQVHVVFQDAPLHEILDTILLTNGYSYHLLGQTIVVRRLEELGNVNPLFEADTVFVRTGNPEDIKDIVQAAKMYSSPKGKVEAIASRRSLAVVDYPANVARIRRFVENLDRAPKGRGGAASTELSADVFEPQFVKAVALKPALAHILSQKGSIEILEAENLVVVKDYPNELHWAKQVLNKVDRPRPQVRITAYIYDIGNQTRQQIGINWSHGLQMRPDALGAPQSLWGIDSLTSIPFDAAATGGVVTFMNMSRHFDLNAIVQLLEQSTDTELLANPNVTVLNNDRADIKIVSEIPYQQLTQTQQGGNIGTTAFREAGITLQVTPRISADGTIEMIVEPEFSRVSGTTEQDDQPIIDRRTAKTTVRVRNGYTLVIGGLRTVNDTGEFEGIPFFKDIPLLGYLFRSRDTVLRESELLVFIRPEIVDYDQPRDHREDSALGATRHGLNRIPVPEGCGVPLDVYEVVPAEAVPLHEEALETVRIGQSAVRRLPPTRIESHPGYPAERPRLLPATHQEVAAHPAPSTPPPASVTKKADSEPSGTSWIRSVFRFQDRRAGKVRR